MEVSAIMSGWRGERGFHEVLNNVTACLSHLEDGKVPGTS